jgi:hypothetical protein
MLYYIVEWSYSYLQDYSRKSNLENYDYLNGYSEFKKCMFPIKHTKKKQTETDVLIDCCYGKEFKQKELISNSTDFGISKG